jgi:hypothetical protein
LPTLDFCTTSTRSSLKRSAAKMAARLVLFFRLKKLWSALQARIAVIELREAACECPGDAACAAPRLDPIETTIAEWPENDATVTEACSPLLADDRLRVAKFKESAAAEKAASDADGAKQSAPEAHYPRPLLRPPPARA